MVYPDVLNSEVLSSHTLEIDRHEPMHQLAYSQKEKRQFDFPDH